MLNAFLIYLGLHLLLYVGLFRFFAMFCQERTIFLYHAGPVLLWGLILVGFFLGEPTIERLEMVVFMACLHGIYSITFLEFWSLAQGGYSLTILQKISRDKDCDFSFFRNVGSAKQENRLDGLLGLGLVRINNNRLALTSKGYIVATCFSLVARIVNLQEEG